MLNAYALSILDFVDFAEVGESRDVTEGKADDMFGNRCKLEEGEPFDVPLLDVEGE